jgi:hypothetical protein
MTLSEAFRISFNAGSGRKRDESVPDNVEQVGWTYGIIGIAILVAAQGGLLLWSASDLGPAVLRDLAIVAFTALAIPFIVFVVIAATLRRMDRLPAAFLYMGVIFAALQVISAVLSNFGSSSSGFLVGILGAVSYLAAKGFLKLSWPVALAVAVVVVIGFMGAGMLLFALPSGRLFT